MDSFTSETSDMLSGLDSENSRSSHDWLIAAEHDSDTGSHRSRHRAGEQAATTPAAAPVGPLTAALQATVRFSNSSISGTANQPDG